MNNKLILGTAQFRMHYGINNHHGKPHREEVFKILDYAFKNGTKYIDTATGYGDAIDLISEFHRKKPEIRFNIINKLNSNEIADEEYFMNLINKLDIQHYYAILFYLLEEFKNSDEKILKKLEKYK